MKVRFRDEHLLRFSAASLDFNPLHLSESYARTTASGERVVYGMLGFLACLREVPFSANQIPSSVRIDFKSPLVLDVDYTVSVDQKPSGDAGIVLLDGSATMMRARIEFRSSSSERASLPETGIAPRQEPRQLQASDFAEILSSSGIYGPARAEYQELLQLLGIDRDRWGDALPLAALCSSYMTGMEVPGESATYSGLRLKLGPAQPKPPFAFEITLVSYNADFDLAQSQFALGGTAGIWASGEMSAIARTPRSHVASACIEVGSGRFAERSALIIGASRGLGAAMALNMVAEGGTVVGVYSRSEEDARELLAASRNLPGRLIMERGDASDLNWCIALKGRVRAELKKLDLLICNAAPALQPLRVEEACYERIHAYIEKGFSLVAAPLSSFLELLSSSCGCVLMVSSTAVNDPPAVWPHYVALKTAAEGLVRTAAAANPKVAFLIARPGRMLTDLTSTPLGRLDAEMPQAVARRILAQVWEETPSGTVRFCD